jgi:hypothetical protein
MRQTIAVGATSGYEKRGNPSQHARNKMRSDQRPRGRYTGNRPFKQQPQRGPQRNHVFDSNGPSLKIRGSAHQIFERYVSLAREAAIGGDRVAAENFYQHAEHYFRMAKENREDGQPGNAPRPTTPADIEMNSSEGRSSEGEADQSQSRWQGDGSGPADNFTR